MKSFKLSIFKITLSPRLIKLLLHLLLGTLAGTAWFLVLYGRYPLYFTHVNWLYTHGLDLFQTQIGWEWFRQEPWRFPLGRIESYIYPFGTYYSYTTAIVPLGLLFKILSPWLENNFQFVGLWTLISVIGQMLVSMWILDEFTRSYPQKILGASLLVLSPPMLLRVFDHSGIIAHWILLAAIWFILLEYRNKLWRGAWIVLFILASLISPYFVAMIVPLWGIGLFFRYSKQERKWLIFTDILAVTGTIVLIGYSFGLFSISGNYLAMYASGIYSWNLNGFINPQQFSILLKGMALGADGIQSFESFSYLGFGNLLILSIALFLSIQKGFSRNQLRYYLPCILVSILFIIFSLSQKAYFGSYQVWDIQLPNIMYLLFSIFHAQARFIWPVFYLLVLFGIISLLRNYRFPSLILLLALTLQYIDLQPLINSKKLNGFVQMQSKLQAEVWHEIAKTNDHVILLPATWDTIFAYEPFALYARQNHMTINWGYVSRDQFDLIEEYGDQVWQELKANRSDAKTIYIFWKPEWAVNAQKLLSDQMLICQIDGYTSAFSVDNEITNSGINLIPYCTVPSPD